MAIQLRELTSDEVVTIERLAQSQMSSAKLKTRARIIWFASRGVRPVEISKQLSISASTVRQWVKQFNKDGLAALASEAVICPGCGTMMPTLSRFCRTCGQSMQGGVAPAEPTTGPLTPVWPEPPPTPAYGAGPPYGTRQFDGTGQFDAPKPFDASQPYEFIPFPEEEAAPSGRRYRRVMLAVLLVALLAAIGFPLYKWSGSSPRVEAIAQPVPVARSYFGAMNFKGLENGGVYIDAIYPPGGPADEAGLIGGDVITSYDTQNVHTTEDLKEMVAQTPIGKTVQIVFIRDGETKTAKLTTTSRNEIDRLDKAFDERPEGKGFLGEGNDLERVPVPGTKLYGVLLKSIRPKLPADQSGLLNGDIVIEFDGIPIRTRKELEMRVERTKPDSVVKIVAMRGTQRMEFDATLIRNY